VTRRPRRRGRCLRCGGPRGKGVGSDGTCRACVLAAARARRERMAGMAAEGNTSPAIAAAFDTSPEVVRVTLWRLRHAAVNTTVAPDTVSNR